MEQRLDIRIVDAQDADLLALVNALDAEIDARYPDLGIVGLACTAGDFLAVAYLAEAPVGCGAMRELEPGVGEIKRMFVVPSARRRGVARGILGALEVEAIRRGYSRLRLGSGVRQPEALTLYQSCGFRRTPLFGEYVGGTLTVCFEKSLG